MMRCYYVSERHRIWRLSLSLSLSPQADARGASAAPRPPRRGGPPTDLKKKRNMCAPLSLRRGKGVQKQTPALGDAPCEQRPAHLRPRTTGVVRKRERERERGRCRPPEKMYVRETKRGITPLATPPACGSQMSGGAVLLAVTGWVFFEEIAWRSSCVRAWKPRS